jgi:hypothetical protein
MPTILCDFIISPSKLSMRNVYSYTEYRVEGYHKEMGSMALSN